MPVTPYCNHLFQSRQDLHQFLLACQQDSLDKKQPKIISISFKTDSVDPLVVLQKLSRSDQLSFYFEKQEFRPTIATGNYRTSMAAIGSVAQLQIEGRDRFAAAKAFIQATLANTTVIGAVDSPLAGPRFCCSFSFFDYNSVGISGFPAATIFLPSWQVSRQRNCSIIVANLAIHSSSNLKLIGDQLWSKLQEIRAIKYEIFSPVLHHREILKHRDVADTNQFKQAVVTALKSIQTQVFNKIVLAHAVDVNSPLPFQIPASLNNLRILYPDCYLFLIHNGKGQTFIGASPERLVSLRNQRLITDALAGSAPRGRKPCEDAHLANGLLNSAKELHEHRVVSDFIACQLAQLGLTPQFSPLRLLQLSNIQHLQTPIHAVVPTAVHLLDIVGALHPTPAVAGLPREVACDHIRQHETFERSLYAAPIGWVDHRGNGEFAVGIRSALIAGCHAKLYAGAGIVSGSDPNRELAEVQLKLQALLAALI